MCRITENHFHMDCLHFWVKWDWQTGRLIVLEWFACTRELCYQGQELLAGFPKATLSQVTEEPFKDIYELESHPDQQTQNLLLESGVGVFSRLQTVCVRASWLYEKGMMGKDSALMQEVVSSLCTAPALEPNSWIEPGLSPFRTHHVSVGICSTMKPWLSACSVGQIIRTDEPVVGHH